MKTNWDLSVFYGGFDDPAFAADLASLPERTKALADAIAAPAQDQAEKLRVLIAQLEQLYTTVEHVGLMINLTLSCDA